MRANDQICWAGWAAVRKIILLGTCAGSGFKPAQGPSNFAHCSWLLLGDCLIARCMCAILCCVHGCTRVSDNANACRFIHVCGHGRVHGVCMLDHSFA